MTTNTSPTIRILVAEDEDIARENLVHIIKGEGYEVVAAEDGTKASLLLQDEEFDLVLTDLSMPGISGMELLEKIKSEWPDIEVLVITGYATIDSAVEAMRKGAYHYISKPYKIDEIRLLVNKAIEKRCLRREVNDLRQQIREGASPQIIGQSPAIVALRKAIEQVAPVDCNVLILGETGTGKELVAKSIHALSPRRNSRFLAVNCAAFTEDLLTNELFGHESGAFTGAKKQKKGLMESADAGTFFLDEIGDMPLSMQAKILRVIEERTVMRLGGTKEVPVDIRIMAATNRNLKVESKQGAFRQDLFFRLNVVTLYVPTLAERREDIPLLCNYFLQRTAESLKKPVPSISEKAMERICAYAFPGNVRELENIIERTVIMTNGNTIHPANLPDEFGGGTSSLIRVEENEVSLVSLQENEKRYIEKVLRKTDNNKTKAAEILSIDRASLWRKMKRYGLN